MNLRDLQYLVSVADHTHFGRAAEACNVSQPTLSMQIKKLEEYLGVQLLERTNKQVMLTPTGHAVVEAARKTLQEAARIKAIAQAAKDPFAGEIRMAVFPTLAPYLLPSLVPKIRQHLPKLSLLLVEEKTPQILEMLERGELDCALVALPVEHPLLVGMALFEEPFFLAVSASHPLAKRISVAPENLKELNLLLLDEGHCLRDQALEVCQSIGMGEAKHFRATSLETLRQMVAAGSATTLMPKLAIRKDDTLIRYIPFREPSPSRTIGLVWRKTSAREALYRKLAELIRKL